MSKRRVWVKRPSASPTLISIASDELVDDLRDQILRKYSNSLGRTFDAPDVEIRILPRAHALPHLHEGERRLTADEQIWPILESYFPGGQAADDALLIEVPTRRATPRVSPRVAGLVHSNGVYEGVEAVDYFSGSAPFSPGHHSGRHHHHHSTSIGNAAAAVEAMGPMTIAGTVPPTLQAVTQPHSMAILTTGKLPALPSPGGRGLNGGAAGALGRYHRPKPSRTQTTSPTLLTTSSPAAAAAAAGAASTVVSGGSIASSGRTRPNRSRGNSNASDIHAPHAAGGGAVASTPGPTPPPLPTPPAVPDGAAAAISKSAASGPGSAVAGTSSPPQSSTAGAGAGSSGGPIHTSPHATHKRSLGGVVTSGVGGKKPSSRSSPRGSTGLPPASRTSSTNGTTTTIPPINCLIVEDNIINLRLLEAFMKRLRVRWATALNGRDAVTKWRQGGFHLVLMDIQLPVMNGLDATKEIRRLERANGIGVFRSTVSAAAADMANAKTTATTNAGSEMTAAATASAEGDSTATTTTPPVTDAKDVLGDKAQLFKSPVIVVALTASSLQSDRHEALAAGCNDFLTKPVSFPWLERKVMEWGCMQALIDFDGWRAWKQANIPSPTAGSKNAKGKAMGLGKGGGGKLIGNKTSTTTTSTATGNTAGGGGVGGGNNAKKQPTATTTTTGGGSSGTSEESTGTATATVGTVAGAA